MAVKCTFFVVAKTWVQPAALGPFGLCPWLHESWLHRGHSASWPGLASLPSDRWDHQKDAELYSHTERRCGMMWLDFCCFARPDGRHKYNVHINRTTAAYYHCQNYCPLPHCLLPLLLLLLLLLPLSIMTNDR